MNTDIHTVMARIIAAFMAACELDATNVANGGEAGRPDSLTEGSVVTPSSEPVIVTAP